MVDKLKCLLHSNAPWACTGYANQTEIFSRLLKQAGHDVIISAFHGLRGAIINAGGIPVLPGGADNWGNDILPLHYDRYKPDVLMALMDIWVLEHAVLSRIPMAVWTPIDHEPVPPPVAAALEHCKYPIAMSRFGERQMRKIGVNPYFMPHGVETSVYQPADRKTAREKWQVPDDKFMVVVVAANKGFPSRKSLDKMAKAWARFTETHKDALLYFHCQPVDIHSGFDLLQCCEFYNIPQDNYRFADPYRLLMGNYTPTAMNDLYNAADVLLAPSMGEGFGIPVVEAQSSGCPVIVSDFSAQAELCFGGYKIPFDPFTDWVYTYQGSEQADVNPPAIVKALEWAYEQRGNQTLRTQARAGALDYDALHVLNTHMLPIFQQIAQRERDERDRKNTIIEIPARQVDLALGATG